MKQGHSNDTPTPDLRDDVHHSAGSGGVDAPSNPLNVRINIIIAK
jgi:hypothetical protein